MEAEPRTTATNMWSSIPQKARKSSKRRTISSTSFRILTPQPKYEAPNPTESTAIAGRPLQRALSPGTVLIGKDNHLLAANIKHKQPD